MTTYKIIVNPVAGRGTGERAIPQIEGVLSGYGLDFDLVRTEAPWHAADLAQEAVALPGRLLRPGGGHRGIPPLFARCGKQPSSHIG